MEERKIIKREDLKAYRREHMTVRLMSIESDLSISTINNIEDTSKHLSFSTLTKYMNVLCTILENNGINGPFLFEYNHDGIIVSLGFSKSAQDEADNIND